MAPRTPYASVSDIQRHLTFLPSLTGSSRPTASQAVDQLIAASDEIDAALAEADYTVPIPSASAPVAAGVVREWAAIGAAAKVAYSLPQGADSKHAAGLGDRFSVLLLDARTGKVVLADAPRDPSLSLPRHATLPASGPGASPYFTADSIDDR